MQLLLSASTVVGAWACVIRIRKCRVLRMLGLPAMSTLRIHADPNLDAAPVAVNAAVLLLLLLVRCCCCCWCVCCCDLRRTPATGIVQSWRVRQVMSTGARNSKLTASTHNGTVDGISAGGLTVGSDAEVVQQRGQL
mgnify:FL=1